MRITGNKGATEFKTGDLIKCITGTFAGLDGVVLFQKGESVVCAVSHAHTLELIKANHTFSPDEARVIQFTLFADEIIKKKYL